MKPIGVMQIVDTLETGGAERVAVNIANYLPRDRYTPYLCTTRKEGPLEDVLRPDVGRLKLYRRHTFDIAAGRQLVSFIKTQDIQILHAHGASIFLAGIASAFAPGVRVIWHDHFGRCGTEERPAWLYRIAAMRTDGVIAVNNLLAEWSRSRLSFPADRVWYVPNFVSTSCEDAPLPALPGTPGKRIVCVANFREQKDHITLIRAFALVIAQVSDAQLLLVGPTTDTQQLRAIREEVSSLELAQNVTFLGQRSDVSTILRGSDIGVLSSISEGLPLSLLEYGVAGLAAIATRVGQCSEVLDDGRAGLLVPPSSPAELAEAILAMLRSPEKRLTFGTLLRGRIASNYSAESTMRQICDAYDIILGNPLSAPLAAVSQQIEASSAAKIVQH
jgi:glycosyltransferase involved in cell wall biosynthesis